MWFFSIPFVSAIISVIILILLILGLYKYIYNAFEKEMSRREAIENERRVLIEEALEEIDIYGEYNQNNYSSDSSYTNSNELEEVIIVDLGSGRGLGPDGEIYKIVSSSKDKN